jgi:hypothetical protein
MALSKDWREFLELLNSGAVDYVIVGAESLAFHPDSVGTSHWGLGHSYPAHSRQCALDPRAPESVRLRVGRLQGN